MGRSNLKIGVLTSSRADFGIYYPLLKKLTSDSYFELEIIAFGTHLEERFGETVSEIIDRGFQVAHSIKTLPKGDSPSEISDSIGQTVSKFSKFWHKNHFDLVFALGDRYEMFAAVTSSSPFNINIAHIHAGETTLGAIDNYYRHCISLMSKYLFVANNEYKKRAIEICNRPDDVFNVGALSIDNLREQQLFSKDEFIRVYGIDLSISTILSTFHPETVSTSKNEFSIKELISAFEFLSNSFQIIITMPNSDTEGLLIRKEIEKFGKKHQNIHLVESFGMKGYLSCMKYCAVMIGNTSSGFVEASFFPKWVINIGDRQNGRTLTPNIINASINKMEIIKALESIGTRKQPKRIDHYGEGKAAQKIVSQLKELHATS